MVAAMLTKKAGIFSWPTALLVLREYIALIISLMLGVFIKYCVAETQFDK